jgi:transposase InsO family protein
LRKIKRLRSDRGGEYFSGDFSDFCVEHSIIHERTPPYSCNTLNLRVKNFFSNIHQIQVLLSCSSFFSLLYLFISM